MKITIHSGESVENKCKRQLHPLTEVKEAMKILDETKTDVKVYSNSTDFTSAIYYYGKNLGFDVEIMLNGVSLGDNLDELFKDFNKSLSLLDAIGE